MKLRNASVLLLSSLFLASCADLTPDSGKSSASSSSEATSEESASSSTNNDPQVILNGYNNLSDLYRSKLVYPFSSYKIQCAFSINNDAAYIKEGAGSLKMEMKNVDGGGYSYFVQRFSESDIAGRDFTDLDKFSFWIYNAGEKTTITLALIQKGDRAATKIDKELAANDWTYCEYNLSKLIVSSNADISGFGVLINQRDGTYYLDEWKAYFGATYTEEDEEILDVIDKTNEKVATLDFNTDFSDPEENAILDEVLEGYYQVDPAYRIAINHSDEIADLVSRYCEYLSTSDPANPKIFHFSKAAGLSQVEASILATGVSLSYSKEKKREGTSGSLKVTSTGFQNWTNLYFTPAISFSSYTKFGIWVYSEDRYGFCINWNRLCITTEGGDAGFQGYKEKDDEGWMYFEYSCKGFSGTLEFEFTELDSLNGAVMSEGDLYISDITLIE